MASTDSRSARLFLERWLAATLANATTHDVQRQGGEHHEESWNDWHTPTYRPTIETPPADRATHKCKSLLHLSLSIASPVIGATGVCHRTSR